MARHYLMSYETSRNSSDGIVRIMIINIYFNLQDVVKIPSHLSLLQIVLRFAVDSTQQQQLWKIKGQWHNYKNARLEVKRGNKYMLFQVNSYKKSSH